jgi:26S proteasome regulatory subunit N5
LYQMKLVLTRRDFVRCQILSRKISKKNLAEAGLEGQKVQYFRYLIQYYVHEKMTMDAAKAYQTIFDTYAAKPEEMDPHGSHRLVAF